MFICYGVNFLSLLLIKWSRSFIAKPKKSSSYFNTEVQAKVRQAGKNNVLEQIKEEKGNL